MTDHEEEIDLKPQVHEPDPIPVYTPKTFKVMVDVNAHFDSLDDALAHFETFPTGGDDNHTVSVVDPNGNKIISKAWNFIRTRK